MGRALEGTVPRQLRESAAGQALREVHRRLAPRERWASRRPREREETRTSCRNEETHTQNATAETLITNCCGVRYSDNNNRQHNNNRTETPPSLTCPRRLRLGDFPLLTHCLSYLLTFTYSSKLLTYAHLTSLDKSSESTARASIEHVALQSRAQRLRIQSSKG